MYVKNLHDYDQSKVNNWLFKPKIYERGEMCLWLRNDTNKKRSIEPELFDLDLWPLPFVN